MTASTIPAAIDTPPFAYLAMTPREYADGEIIYSLYHDEPLVIVGAVWKTYRFFHDGSGFWLYACASDRDLELGQPATSLIAANLSREPLVSGGDE